MSKFQSTISVVAALASIFGAGAAGWKLSQESSVKPTEEINSKYETHITELQKQISDLKQQTTTPPAPVSLPQPVVVKQLTPSPTELPPLSPPPPINQETQP